MDLYSAEGIRPKEALRFAYVREQGYDRSCGYSAAASLLSLYWGIAAAEGELVERYAREKIASGDLEVNFKDLSDLFADFGMAVKGVRMSWDQLEKALEAYAPILLHYDSPDRHFVLGLHASDGIIITLDPALGCELQGRDQFMERWSGAALLVFSAAARRDDALIAEALRVHSDRRRVMELRAR